MNNYRRLQQKFVREREWIKTGEYSSSFHVIIPGQIGEEFTQDDEEE